MSADKLNGNDARGKKSPTMDLRAEPLEVETLQSAIATSPATVKTKPEAEPEPGVSVVQNSLVDTAVAPSKKKSCGICKDGEAKYKCSRCALPFCSIACSTIHKTTHPADEPKPTTIQNPSSVTPTHVSDPRPGTVAAAGFQGPFAALDDSDELKALFKLYPRLPAVLEDINKTTLRPTHTMQDGGARRRKEEPWNSDMGLQTGVKALAKARNCDGTDGESLREYSKLILQILSRNNGDSVDELIQKELAAENARIIERLLNGEI